MDMYDAAEMHDCARQFVHLPTFVRPRYLRGGDSLRDVVLVQRFCSTHSALSLESV